MPSKNEFTLFSERVHILPRLRQRFNITRTLQIILKHERVWNYKTCRQLYDFSAPNEQPTRLCFRPKGFQNNVNSINESPQAVFACGFSSGKVRVLNVTEAKLVAEVPSPHTHQNSGALREITDLAFANDGRRLLTGDALKCLCLYDADANFSLLRILPNTLASHGSLTVSPDAKSVSVIGPTDFLITVFETLTLNETLRIDARSQPPAESNAVAVRLIYSSSCLNQLLCVTSSNKLLKFDCRSGRLLSCVAAGGLHRSLTDCLTVSEDGRFLVTSGDNCVKVWDYEMRLERSSQTFVGHSAPVSRVVFTPDQSTLVSVGDSIVFWSFHALCGQQVDEAKDMPQGRLLEETGMHKLILSHLVNFYKCVL